MGSPRKLKQSKLSTFWQSRDRQTNVPVQVNERKRKSKDEVSDVHAGAIKKISLGLNSRSPDIFITPPEEENGENSGVETKAPQVQDYLDDFDFCDFENNPFSSPKKERSPKKGVLAENCSQSPSKCDTGWQFRSSEISFEKPVKCTVLKFAVVTANRFEQVLELRESKTGDRGICRLRDVWTFTAIAAGDTVVVQAVLSADGWVVDNKSGYLTLYPNVTVSSTSLVGAMFCMRRGLLSNFFKGLEPGSNQKMLVGRLVHELLQKCLKMRSCTDEEFAEMVSGFLRSPDYLLDLYYSDMKSVETSRELESFVPSVRNFLDVYVNGERKPTGKNYQGTIEDVLDIEELIRSPNMGFQGRVDVTVKLRSKNKEKVAPLELKTGRASFSTEHRSQLILYVLMMQEIGRRVDSGLLLYLKEGIMEEIVPNRDEIRNLFLLRNRLISYYKSVRVNELPEPIRNPSACNRCPYLRICTSHLKFESLYETHPIRSLEIPDVKSSHVEYFMRWSKMLWLEYGDLMDEDDCEDLDNLELSPEFERIGDEVKHHFAITGDVTEKRLVPGAFVHVYDGKNNRIGTAKVAEFTKTRCSLLMEKQLTDASTTYKIVVYKFKFLNMYLSNLGRLLDEQMENLREIIVDKRPPRFDDKFDKASFKEKCLKKLMSLNKEQQRAVLKSLLSKDYLLIKGPPGTGKTQTIANLVRIYLALGKTVLVAGHTHSSVDNILLRLTDVEFLRLGPLKSVNRKLHSNCYANLIKTCTGVDDVAKLFARQLIASTCSGLDMDFVNKQRFDLCVVDESSQVLQPEVLRPLFCSEKFVLVGDEDQLPPIVQNVEAKRLGMDQSMFEWLASDAGTVKLKYQYRMNRYINALANSIAYGGLIECANDDVAEAVIGIRNQVAYETSERWIRDTLSPCLPRSVVFVDTSERFRADTRGPSSPRSSILEANIIRALVRKLAELGLNQDEVGVIAPFVDQISLLRKKLHRGGNLGNVELNTVDQYQGRDKEVILFSCGKENRADAETSELELLNDVRRLTVAVTRAKHKLVLVGDKRTMARYGPFQKLIKSLDDSNFVTLTDGSDDFTWKDFED